MTLSSGPAPRTPAAVLTGPPAARIPADAVLLDWDELLCDTAVTWRQAEDHVADGLRGLLTPADRRALVGATMDRTAEILLASAGKAATGDAVAGVISQLRERLLWQVTGDGVAAMP